MIEVKIKKLDEKAIIPRYASIGAACFDIHTIHGAIINTSRPIVFSTGLSFEIPEGYVMLVYSRSGHAFKQNARLSNCVGVIDSDYRGELKVKINKDAYIANGFQQEIDLVVEAGDRIAQAMIVPYPKVSFIEVKDLTDTDRGESGFGSTGVK